MRSSNSSVPPLTAFVAGAATAGGAPSAAHIRLVAKAMTASRIVSLRKNVRFDTRYMFNLSVDAVLLDRTLVTVYSAACRQDVTPVLMADQCRKRRVSGLKRQARSNVMDVLAEVMSLLRTKGQLYGRIELSAP